MPKSIDCYKRIFLHVILCRIIVPCYYNTRRIYSEICFYPQIMLYLNLQNSQRIEGALLGNSYSYCSHKVYNYKFITNYFIISPCLSPPAFIKNSNTPSSPVRLLKYSKNSNLRLLPIRHLKVVLFLKKKKKMKISKHLNEEKINVFQQCFLHITLVFNRRKALTKLVSFLLLVSYFLSWFHKY